MIGYLALVGFAATIPVANWLIGNVGTECIPQGPCLIPVGFGLMAPSGVLMIGLALVLRDLVHERLGAWWAAGAIVVGAGLSFLLASPFLAIASGIAFLLSEAADMAVYTPLRKRRLVLRQEVSPGATLRVTWAPPIALAVLLSGVVGSIIDSAVFLWLAFGSLDFIAGQVVGKAWMSLAAIVVLGTVRVCERKPS